MVMFLQSATGATLSCTVTVELQVDVLPLLSVTVKVTVLAPTLEQLKLVLEATKEAIPQASLDPLLISAAVMVALPLEFN